MFFSDPLVLWYKPDSPQTPETPKWDGPLQIVVQDCDLGDLDLNNNSNDEGK